MQNVSEKFFLLFFYDFRIFRHRFGGGASQKKFCLKVPLPENGTGEWGSVLVFFYITLNIDKKVRRLKIFKNNRDPYSILIRDLL